jgi:hypothetical protein
MSRSPIFRITLPMIVTASTITLMHTAPNIQKAYAIQMSLPGIDLELQDEFATGTPLPNAPAAPPNMKCFMGDLVKAAADKRSMMLWGMYPASIRGRILSRNSTAINDPLLTHSSTSIGGGW